MLFLISHPALSKGQPLSEASLPVPSQIWVESVPGKRWAERHFPNAACEIYDENVERDFEKHHRELSEALKTNEVSFLMSDGGTPCLGDPGFKLVRLAHDLHVGVRCAGLPSFIAAAIVLSGCEANRFEHLGYPPREAIDRKSLLQSAVKTQKTYSLIETPYRLIACLETLIAEGKSQPDLRVSVSLDLFTQEEKTYSGKVSWWSQQNLTTLLGPKPLGVVVFQNQRGLS